MMDLRDYQHDAADDLVSKANSLLGLQGARTIVFEAPTGSGKTIIMAEFLRRLADGADEDRPLSFIWAAPRKLHDQSKEKLERYYTDSKVLRCSYFEDLTDRQIGENEILFLNWESINKADNVYIRENEQELNLSHVIENTLSEGRTVILVIDESHFAAGTETSKALVQMLQAKVAVDVSATPELTGDEKVTVYREKVIHEQMIKKRISVNPGFKNLIEQSGAGGVRLTSDASESTAEFVIREALKKRAELKEALAQEHANVNPLMLIQLPDRRPGLDDTLEETVRILGEKHHITTSGGKLAIYLSEDKQNLDNITRNDSDVDVMIFKQAIALGWDCPRAAILVLFRDWRSIVFSIQTVGRIMRMPELKHYVEDELNTGFVYTNLSDVTIHGDVAGSYVTTNRATRRPEYRDVKLLSVHAKRFREVTRLSPQFIIDFQAAAQEMKLKDNIDVDVQSIEARLISDGVIADPDKAVEHLTTDGLDTGEASAVTVARIQTETEIQRLFDAFVFDSITPLAPEARSVKRVNDAIYRVLSDSFPTMFEYGGVKGQMVVLAAANRQHFLNVIDRAKETYSARLERERKELAQDVDWEVPSAINYGNDFVRKECKLSIMSPHFESGRASQVEREFAAFLDSHKSDVSWWFKNGERDGTFFAVGYEEDNENRPFYVDWIVQYKDGRTGLFDTKAGITARDAGPRALGLARYIKDQNAQGKKLFGGVIVKRDNSWRYFDGDKYNYSEKDLPGWKFLP